MGRTATWCRTDERRAAGTSLGSLHGGLVPRVDQESQSIRRGAVLLCMAVLYRRTLLLGATAVGKIRWVRRAATRATEWRDRSRLPLTTQAFRLGALLALGLMALSTAALLATYRLGSTATRSVADGFSRVRRRGASSSVRSSWTTGSQTTTYCYSSPTGKKSWHTCLGGRWCPCSKRSITPKCPRRNA